MKTAIIVILPLAALVGGCAAVDALTGTGGGSDDYGVVGDAAKYLGGLPGILGLFGAILGGAGTVYKHVREKRYRKAFEATATGIDSAVQQGLKVELTKEELYSAIRAAAAQVFSNPKKFADMVARVKAAVRSGKEG